ncbi:hypothetical protein ACFL6C_02690 [Myxococcota bacterium]
MARFGEYTPRADYQKEDIMRPILIGLLMVGASSSIAGCRSDDPDPIKPAICGNGVLDIGEACDDGFIDPCACNATCDAIGTGICGDGVVCPQTEQCDDGYTDACGSCNADCTGPGTGATCGDGEVCPQLEVCDDGLTDACGTCNATCEGPGTSTCGDGEVCPETEECDDGHTDACGSCNADCSGSGTGATCGDGELCPELEMCDDGNNIPGDGCSPGCELERGCLVMDTGASQCEGDLLMECECNAQDVCTFQVKEDCAASSKVCWTEFNLGIFGGMRSFCTVACGPGGTGDECEATQYCMDLGICHDTAAHGEVCSDTFKDTPCADVGDACVAILDNDVGACTTECSATEIGTQGSCPAGETCLRTNMYIVATPCGVSQDCDETAGFFCQDFSVYGLGNLCAKGTVRQPDFALQETTCTEATADTDCLTTEGWECVDFWAGAKCGLNAPICGTITPFWDGTTQTTVHGDVVPDAYICGLGAQMCGVVETTADPDGPAEAFCFNDIFDTSAFGICVATCGTNDPEVDLGCGDGYLCVQPAPGDDLVFLWDRQNGGGVTCTEETVDADCTAPYTTCMSFVDGGWQCAKPAKVCQPE